MIGIPLNIVVVVVGLHGDLGRRKLFKDGLDKTTMILVWFFGVNKERNKKEKDRRNCDWNCNA